MYSDDIEIEDALKLYTRYDVDFNDLFELIENTGKCNIIMDKEIRRNDIVF